MANLSKFEQIDKNWWIWQNLSNLSKFDKLVRFCQTSQIWQISIFVEQIFKMLTNLLILTNLSKMTNVW